MPPTLPGCGYSHGAVLRHGSAGGGGTLGANRPMQPSSNRHSPGPVGPVRRVDPSARLLPTASCRFQSFIVFPPSIPPAHLGGPDRLAVHDQRHPDDARRVARLPGAVRVPCIVVVAHDVSLGNSCGSSRHWQLIRFWWRTAFRVAHQFTL